MKRLILLISATLLSLSSLALLAAPISKTPNSLQRLNKVWSRHGIEGNPAHLKEDAHIVYGGQDVSPRPTEMATNFA